MIHNLGLVINEVQINNNRKYFYTSYVPLYMIDEIYLIEKDRKQKLIERYNEGIQDIVARANMVMRDIEVSFLEDLLN